MAHNFIALQSVHVKGNSDDCVKSEQTLAPFSLPSGGWDLASHEQSAASDRLGDWKLSGILF